MDGGLILSIDVGIRNLASCTLEKVGGTVHWWEVADILSYNSCSKAVKRVTMLETLTFMKKYYDDKLTSVPDSVLIEQQPNARMRGVSLGLCGYFMQRFPLAEVKLVSGKRKMKLCSPQDKADAKRAQYEQNKARAVEACGRLIGKHAAPALCEMYSASKKKDDLADAFLMGLSFCEG